MNQLSPDEILFMQLCQGIVQLCDRLQRGDPAYLWGDAQPFPHVLYKAFQGLSKKWIERDEKMRHPSILCLVEAARISIEKIEPDFARLEDIWDPEQPLIENKIYPSGECQDWASEYSLNLESDQNQGYITRLMTEIKAKNLPTQVYTLCRRFIAEHPFPSGKDFTRFQDENPEVEAVFSILREAYQDKIPPQSELVRLCQRCGGYLHCAAQGIEGCCQPLPFDTYLDKAVIQDTVRYVIRPSLIELRLEAKLRELGLEVELWPDLDKFDLKITFSSGESWGVDAKDWYNPKKLATTLNQDSIPNLGQKQSFWVVPDYRWTRNYELMLKNHYHQATPILGESEFIKKVKGAIHEKS